MKGFLDCSTYKQISLWITITVVFRTPCSKKEKYNYPSTWVDKYFTWIPRVMAGAMLMSAMKIIAAAIPFIFLQLLLTVHKHVHFLFLISSAPPSCSISSAWWMSGSISQSPANFLPQGSVLCGSLRLISECWYCFIVWMKKSWSCTYSVFIIPRSLNVGRPQWALNPVLGRAFSEVFMLR